MSGNDPLQSLFQAGRSELPSAAAKAKAAAAIGLGGGAVAAAGVTAATIIKVAVAVAVVGGGAFVGGMQVGEKRSEEKYQAKIAELEARKPEVVVVREPAPPAPEPAPTPVVEPVVEPPKPKVAPHPKEEDTLALELAALDRVRTKMRDDDFSGALAELSAYEKKFPKGAMSTEASLMRIETLLKAGKRDDAQALGARLLEGSAPELMKQRVRRLLEPK